MLADEAPDSIRDLAVGAAQQAARGALALWRQPYRRPFMTITVKKLEHPLLPLQVFNWADGRLA